MATKNEAKPVKGLTLVTGYLFLYNVIQFLGWSGVYMCVMMHFIMKTTTEGVWDKAEFLLYIFQTAAILEVVHVALGFVRSSVVLTGVQVASRVFLIWGILYSVPQVQDCMGVSLLLVAWSVTEVIRYSFYAFSFIGGPPYILVWLRYTLFYILYPMGVTGELWCIYSALPYVKESGLFSYPLPNQYNVSFDYWLSLIIIMLVYIPGFPQLYFYMISQRKKIIGGGSADSRKKVQ